MTDGRPLHQQPTLAGQVARELAELTADLRAAVEWEQGGGARGWPDTPPAEATLPELVIAPAHGAGSPPARVARAGVGPPAAPAASAAREAAAGPPAVAAAPPGLAAEDAAPPGLAAEDARDLDELRAVLGDCRRCKLAQGRSHIVFGQGNADADLLLVGEAPGYHEDKQGLAFVGPAGELLTRILQAIDLTRDDVYICNVVKCRPPQNRDPEEEEVAACRPFLERQIALVRPRAILVLGRVAARALLGLASNASLASVRGRFHELHGIPVMVTYHPAALLRDGSLKRPVWQDVQAVRDRLTAR